MKGISLSLSGLKKDSAAEPTRRRPEASLPETFNLKSKTFQLTSDNRESAVRGSCVVWRRLPVLFFFLFFLTVFFVVVPIFFVFLVVFPVFFLFFLFLGGLFGGPFLFFDLFPFLFF